MSKNTTNKTGTEKISDNEELKTEAPVSEKDEVKAAERRTAKQQEKAGDLKSDKK